MNVLIAVLVILVAAVAIGLLRVLIPYAWSIATRTRQAGPVAIGSPGGAGTFYGWMGTALWSLGEERREEAYEYAQETEREMPKEVEIVDWRLQSPSDLGADVATERMGQRAVQPVTADGRSWWSGRDWVSTDQYVPPSAERSVDGRQWWDGERWRWVPGEWQPASSWTPRRIDDPPVKDAGGTWVVAQRRHTADRWVVPPSRTPERSDPPPTWVEGGDRTA